MSYDLWLWRRATKSNATNAQIYATISENGETNDLAPLNVEELGAQLDAAFPGWRTDEQPEQLPFLCTLDETAVVVETYGSTPSWILEWFAELASREGLEFFDPQTQEVPEADQADAKRAADAARRGEAQVRAAREFGDLAVRAELGDTDAQCELGNRYSFGEGTDRDLRLAAHWYAEAAKNGSTDAMFNLAASFQRGEGVDPNIQAAIYWYSEAAKCDFTYATFALGDIYLYGDGVERDNERAREWFTVALKNGHPDANAALRMLEAPEITPAMKRKAWKFWTQ